MDITKTKTYKKYFDAYLNWINQKQIKTDLIEGKRRE